MAKRKHQESISSPRKQLHWQNLSDVTILKLEATEGLQFPEEYLDGKLWLILVSFSYPSFIPNHGVHSCACVLEQLAYSL